MCTTKDGLQKVSPSLSHQNRLIWDKVNLWCWIDTEFRIPGRPNGAVLSGINQFPFAEYRSLPLSRFRACGVIRNGAQVMTTIIHCVQLHGPLVERNVGVGGREVWGVGERDFGLVPMCPIFVHCGDMGFPLTVRPLQFVSSLGGWGEGEDLRDMGKNK